MSYSNFTGNNGSSTGGAIYSTNAVNIDYSNFISNSRAIHLVPGDTRSNISNSNFTNNTVAMYISSNYTSVTQNNIINNNQGIVIYGTASRILGVKINYNRIFNNTNTTGYDLENLGNVNATLNWWGSNNPKINVGSPANYFIVNISNINPNTLNYSLVLNNGNVEYDLSLMPDFNGSISSSLGVDIFDAKDNNILTYSPEYVHIEVDNYGFVLSTDVYVNATGGNDNNDGSSWDTALVSINKALWMVKENGIIHIAGDSVGIVYSGVLNRNQLINITNVTLSGEYGKVNITGEGTSNIFNVTVAGVNLVNLTLTNGRSPNNGGAIYIALGSSLNIDNCTFVSNIATYNGSSIYNNGVLAIQGSNFTGTTAGNGNIFNNGTNLNISNSTFSNNNANGYGGAIYNFANGPVTISDSIFTNNNASSYNGGAIYNTRGDINISRSNFTSNGNNYANYGNNIYNALGNTIIITDSSFLNNSVAIYNQGNLTILDTNFASNPIGITNNGANSNTTVINSSFTSNAIGISNEGKFNLDNSSFINNNNTGISNTGTFITDNSNFINNSNTGISNTGTFNLNNSNFTYNNGNTAGIYNTGGTFVVDNSNFINNTGSTSGAIYNSAKLNVSNSNFTGNTGSTSGAIYSIAGLNVIYSNFISNSRAIYSGPGDTRSNISNSNFTNNGMALYIYSNSTSITQNNIINNNQGIFISTTRVNGVKVNYNRIFNNTNGTGYDLENLGSANATLNWWGNNNPKISGGTPANYFIVNISNMNLITLDYSLVLNIGSDYDLSLLPDFNGSISYNNGSSDIFNAKEDNTLAYSPEYVDIVVDNYRFIESIYVYVNATGGNDNNNGTTWTSSLATIEQALKQVSNGGTIYLAGSNYNNTNGLDLNNTKLIINKTINFVGASALSGEVIINGLNNGRLFNITSGQNVTFTNITFANSYLTGSGNNGAIYINNSNVTFTNSNFVNNTAYDGGAIYYNGTNYSGTSYNGTNSELIINNSTFTNNKASNNGGAIYNIGSFNLSGSNFINNSANFGGAVYNVGIDFLANENNFINNTATNNYGGAILNYGNNSSFINNNFTNNKALYIGGAILDYGNNTVFINNNFTNNAVTTTSTSYNYGGAIVSVGIDNTVINNTFINNTARSGGAISASGANFTINNSLFLNNSGAYGGAINSTGPNFVLGSNITFVNNSATAYGGAIYNTGVNFTVGNDSTFANNNNNNNNIFINNSATTNGGAIYNTGVNFTIGDNSIFVNNSAINGSIIYNYGGTGFVLGNNSTFVNNSAIGWGGIYNTGVNFTVGNDSTFANNFVRDHDGAAIYNTGSGFIVGNNSNFINNTVGGNGAVIYNTGPNFITGDNSTFVNNSATGYGGVIYNTGSGFVVGNSSIFIHNSATSNGGAIYNTGASFIVGNSSTFVSNSAINGSAIYIQAGSITVNYNRFYNNVGNGQVYINGGTASLDYNWWGDSNNPEEKSVKRNSGTLTLNNYFIVEVNSVLINETSGQTTFEYTFSINDSSDYELDLLPDFNGNLRDKDGQTNITFDAKVNNSYIISITPESTNRLKFTVDSFYAVFFTEISSAYVNATGGSDDNFGTGWDDALATIEKALEYVQDGGTIYLAGNSYNNSNSLGLRNTNLVISKNLTFVGVTALGGEVILDGLNSNARIFSINSGLNVTFLNITFVNSKLTGTNNNGSAIYVNTNSLVTIINSNFINNSAYSGGAIYNVATNLSIINSTFKNNNASYSGGAILNTGINFTILNSNFINNSAINGGGAVNNTGANFTVNNSNFTNNTAVYGGAMRTGGIYNLISNNSFINNSAGADGGAILSYGVNFTLLSNILLNNSARYGGALYTLGAGANISYNRFYNNHANDTTVGDNQYLVNAGGTGTANYNWWGNNTNPLLGSIQLYNTGTITLTNYFQAEVITTLINIASGETTFEYSFHLNDSSAFDSNLLPNFDGSITDKNGEINIILIPENNSYILNITPESTNKVKFAIDGFRAIFFNDNNMTYVNATGGSDDNWGTSWDDALATIEKALEYVQDGGTIYIAGNNYNNTNGLPLKNTNLNINKNVTLMGATALSGEVIIDGLNSNNRLFNILSGSNVTFINLTLANTKFTSSYGSVYVNNGAILNLIGSNLINNTAVSGGAIYNHGTLNIQNSSFINNTASSEGGAITNIGGTNSGGTLNIRNSSFINSSAGARGGAIYNSGLNVIIENNVLFDNNRGTYAGGAIYNYGTNMTIRNNVSFINNYATSTSPNENYGGGAIYNYRNMNLFISDTLFENNHNTDVGGAIDNWGAMTVINSAFTNNYATLTATYLGEQDGAAGAIMHDGSGLIIINTTFTGNYAAHAGAIDNRNGGNTLITNCTFIGNHVTTHGGAINNHANILNVTVIDSVFINNTAGDRGGAMDIQNTPMNVTNCTFVNNSAVNSGGAISCTSQRTNITFAEFDGNSAKTGGAIYVSGGSYLNVFSSNFINNRATVSAGALYSSGGSYVVVNYNRFYRNTLNGNTEGAVYFSSSNGNANYNWWGTNNNPIGNNATLATGILNNWYVLRLSLNYTLSTISNATFNYLILEPASLSYNLTLNDPTLAHSPDRLPYFLVNVNVLNQTIPFNGTSGDIRIVSFAQDDIILYNLTDEYAINALSDDEDVILKIKAAVNDRLSIIKIADVYVVSHYDTVTFTIVVTNEGPSTITNVKFTDLLDSRFELINYTGGISYDNTTGIWELGDIEGYGSVTLTMTVNATGLGEVTNLAWNVTADQELDDPDINSSVEIDILPLVNVTIIKVVNVTGNYTTHIGDTVKYTINITNHGPDATLANVFVYEMLSEKLEYVNHTSTHGTFDSPSGIWHIGTLDVNETATLEIEAIILESGTIVNTAELNTEIPNLNNNTTVTVEFEVGDVNVSIIKVSNATGSNNVGDIINYTITIINYGLTNATGVYVYDNLNTSKVQYIDHSASIGSYNPITGMWNISDLNSGETVELNITVLIIGTGNIINTANVTTNETNTNNKTNDTEIFNVDNEINVTIIKVSNATENNHVGDNITYTITIFNDGLTNATDVYVMDNLDFTKVQFISASASIGTYNNTSGIWTIGNIDAGTNATLYINVTITGTGIIVNTANVTTTETNINNKTNDTEVFNVTDEVNVTIIKVSNATENNHVGDNVTYTITIFNDGLTNASDVYVMDNLDFTKVQFISASASIGTYNNTSGIWTIGNLEAGTNATLYINVIITGTGIIVNTANVTTTETNINNKTNDTEVFNVTDDVNVTIIKVSNATANNHVGDNITYTITIINYGLTNATDVYAIDNLDHTKVQFINAYASTGTYNNIEGIWTIGNLTAGTSATLYINVTITGTGIIANNANVTTSENNTNNQTNDTEIFNVTDDVNVTIIKVSNATANDRVYTGVVSAKPKSLSNATVNNYVGDNITYTITIINYGLTNATNVYVMDNLDYSKVQFISASASMGTYNNTTGIWTIGNLEAGASVTLDIEVTIIGTGIIFNNANVTTNENNINNQTNDTEIFNVGDEVNVTIIKVSNATENNHVGDNITYTITIINDGLTNASDVYVMDNLDYSKVQFISASASMGTYNNTTGRWTIGNLEAGTSVTLYINVTITGTGIVFNNANVTTNENNTNNQTNDTEIFNVTDEVNVTIIKVSNATENNYVGDNITYTITIINNGLTNATDVYVMDNLDHTKVQFIDAFTNTGTYNNTTGIWTIGNLEAGASVTLYINVTITGTGIIANTANVTTHENNINNKTNDTEIFNVTDDVNVTIIKISNATASNHVGDNITYTITIINHGLTNASDVYVMDNLDYTKVQFISASASMGTYNNTTGIWTIGNLEVGASVTLYINVTITGTGIVFNNANLTTSENNTNNQTNDTEIFNVTDEVNVTIIKISNATANNHVGDNINYTITIINFGLTNATNVYVMDNLDYSKVQFIDAFTNTGTYNNTTGIWTIGNLEAGASVTLDIEVTIIGTGIIFNNANVTTNENNINNQTNDTEIFNVGDEVNVTIIKVSNATENNHVGDNITYTITIINDGLTNATDVYAMDNLDHSKVQFISASASIGTYDNTTGIWTIGNLEAGTSVTLYINVTITGTGIIANTANVTTNENNTNNQTNDTEIFNVTDEVNVTIIKVSNATVNNHVGDNITYTITIINYGLTNATDVYVMDNLDYTKVQFISASASMGTYNSTTGIWTVGNLEAGASVTLYINVTITGTGIIANTANVTTNENNTNNQTNDTEIFNVTDDVNVTIIKVSNATENNHVGDNITYTITIINNGLTNASDVYVMDNLDYSKVQFISASASMGTYNNTTGIWTIGNLEAGASVTLYINVTITGTGIIANNANVTTHENNINNKTNDTEIFNVTDEVNVTIIKISNATVSNHVGDSITYTITVINHGLTNASDVYVMDNLDYTKVQFISASASMGTYNNTTGIWTIGNLEAGTSVTLDIEVTIIGTGIVFNNANVTTNENNINNQTNDTEIFNVGDEVNVTIIKVSNATENNHVGDNITYTITVINHGLTNASDVYVMDNLDHTKVQFISASASMGTYNNTTGRWTIGNLEAGTTATLTINVTITGTGIIFNNANVTTNENNTNNQTNDTEIFNVSDEVNVTIIKVSNATVNNHVGDNVTYTITVINYGLTNASDVYVMDNLDHTKLQFISASASMGTYNNTTGRWTIGNLEAGTSATLYINVTITGTGIIANTANVTTSENNTNNQTNDTEIFNVTDEVNVTIIKVSNATVNNHVGDNVTYTITVINYGLTNASDVYVMDNLDYTKVQFISASASMGAYNNVTGRWTIGDLEAGATATLTINVTIIGTGIIFNNANVTTSENNTNNQTNDTEIFNVSDEVNVTIIKVSNATVNNHVGDNVTYTITIINYGLTNASDVYVMDNLDHNKVQFISASASMGTYNNTTGRWTIGDLDAGTTATLTINVTITGTGIIFNNANVTTSENNTNNQTNDTEIFNVADDVNVTIIKVSNATVNNHVGDNVTYTITIINHGLTNASDVYVMDNLDYTKVQFISASASMGAYNNVTGRWTIGDLEAGATATLTINVTIIGTGIIFNNANVTTSENNTNNQTNDTEIFNVSDEVNVTIIKVSNATVNNHVGDNVTYTITVINYGLTNASDVFVMDNLDYTKVQFINASASMGAYDNATGRWTIGDLEAGATATLIINVTITGTGIIFNNANVTTSENNTNNQTNDTEIFNVTDEVNATIIKISNATENNHVGDNVTYTITVINYGLTNASDVFVMDNLDYTKVQFINASASIGTYNNTTGRWTIGNLEAGTSATLYINVTITGTRIIANTANVTTSENNTNNQTNDTEIFNVTDEVNVTIIKVSNATVNNHVGDNVTYTITVINYGLTNASDVYVMDNLDYTKVQFISASASMGVYNNVTGRWTIGDLEAGATATLTINVTIIGTGIVFNNANVTTSESNTNNQTNDTEIFNVSDDVDVTIIKVSNATVNNHVGDNVTYTITIINYGLTNASDVYVMDNLDHTKVQFISASASIGMYDNVTGKWTIGNLTAGTNATLFINVTTTGTGIIANTANVTTSENNTNNETNDTVIFNVTDDVNVTIIKVSNATVNNHIGDNVTYTITIINYGLTNATGVYVVDNLDYTKIQYINASANTGTYDNTTGIWTIGNLTSGTTATLTINVTIMGIGTIINTANVTTSENNTNNQTNDTEIFNVTDEVNVTIIKISNATEINYVGDSVIYTITIVNYGLTNATGVYVVDNLDYTKLQFNDASASIGIYDNTTGIWTIGNLTVGTNATLNINVTITGIGTVINTASLITHEDNTNNQTNDTVIFNVSDDVNVTIIKVSNATEINYVGDTITYTIIIINQGPTNATGVYVTDNLDHSKIQFINASATQGSYDVGEGIWTVGNLEAGANVTLTINVTVTSEGIIVNTATVNTNENNTNDQINDTATFIANTTEEPIINETEDKINYTPNIPIPPVENDTDKGDDITFEHKENEPIEPEPIVKHPMKAKAVAMKTTGVPLIVIIMVLSLFGLISIKRKSSHSLKVEKDN
ncbi:DUF11 domain-containing protein [Methanobrevibacter filiformis]|uniref:Putative outer membrane protein pmp6 n=1 Tax=Methanobrevibacter filiformis TaxID=55758 RepID=A0A165ZSY3_9EURY|nr:DUF11 domain-containing protein [Methanobrevibacter filiformis]KZX11122.1 putative outer membrane protein pmp6 precursor [Methanobrevibacter filiformis]